jgi:type II secretory pathway component PulM
MKNLTKHLKKHSFFAVCIGFVALGAVWGLFIMPMQTENAAIKADLPNLKKELMAIREIAGQIRHMEDSLTDFTPAEKAAQKQTVLKQVETLAKDTKIFHKITRLSPTQVRKEGQDFKGLVVELDETNIAEVTPFLHALAHKSLLSLHSAEMRRLSDKEGQVMARLTVLEN